MLPRRTLPGVSVNARCRSSGKDGDGTEVAAVTFDRTVSVGFAFACISPVDDGAARTCVGLNGEGARAGGARVVEVVEAVGALRFCAEGDVTALRPTTLALLLTFALILGAGVGEGEVGRDFKGDGGRERSWPNLGVTWNEFSCRATPPRDRRVDLYSNLAVHGTLHV